MEQPLVSVVMNCYNSDRFLKEAIDSVVAQSYTNWEIIFWDNASTDQSATIAKSYDQRLRYFSAEETTPLGEARNLALEKATGKYVAFLDCDDLYLPTKLEKQVKMMEQHNYALCYGSAIMLNEQGKEVKRFKVSNRSGELFGALLKHYEINMQSVLLRRELLIKEQLSFITSLKYCPDHNLFMEIASRYPVGVTHEFIVKYRLVDDSLSRRTVDIAASEVKFTLDKIVDRAPMLRQQFSKEFEQAYNKLHYYEAIAAIYRNDRKQAQQELRAVISTRVEYLLLYLLLYIPLPNNKILRILGR